MAYRVAPQAEADLGVGTGIATTRYHNRHAAIVPETGPSTRSRFAVVPIASLHAVGVGLVVER